MNTTVKTSFGTLSIYKTDEGKYHGCCFGIERNTIPELITECERIYHLPIAPSNNSVYESQYAYACGYQD